MTGLFHLGDLDLAALISSRICHDVISPVGAIANGLEVLDEENDEQVREYALDLIRRSADQASAKLQFARIAFGAAGSAGSEIGLPMIESIARGILDPEKHVLELTSEPGSLVKNQTKLLLNMFSIAITMLPRGGTISIEVTGAADAPEITVSCEGKGVRIPDRLPDLIVGKSDESLDSMSIQPYYASRIAAETNMAMEVAAKDTKVILQATPSN